MPLHTVTNGQLSDASDVNQYYNLLTAGTNGPVAVAALPAMGASGASHAAGIVPDPGSVAGTTRYLREDATWAAPAGGAGAMTLIATQTLASAAASITFSAIPGTYRHLLITAVCRCTGAGNGGNLRFQFNGDTATNYSYATMYTSGTAQAASSAGAQTSGVCGILTGAGNTAAQAVPNTIFVLDYATTTWSKSAIGQTIMVPGANNVVQAGGGWTSTAAITSVTLFSDSGTFVAGSDFALYGLS